MQADKIRDEAEVEIVTQVDAVILEVRKDHHGVLVYEAEEAQLTVKEAIEVPAGNGRKM